MHGDCGIEAAYGEGVKDPQNTNFKAICMDCIDRKELRPMTKGANEGKIAARRIKDCTDKITKKEYKPLHLVKAWKDDDAMEIDEMEDNQDEETLDGNNKSVNTNTSQPETEPLGQVVMEGQTPTYMDLQLNIPPTKEEGMEAPIAMLAKTLKTWMKGIQEIEPTFKLHTVDTASKNQIIVHHLKDFPKSLAEIQALFHKSKPLTKGGKLYMKILASFNCSPQKITENVQWWHQERKERFQKSALQCAETTCVGWLLFSLPYTDKELLQTRLEFRNGQQLELKWMRISDGKPWKPGRDTKEDPKAIHVWCDKKHQSQVQESLQGIYGSTASGPFPLGMKLRYIKPIQQLCSFEAKNKYQCHRQHQSMWCKQACAIQLNGIHNIDIKKGKDEKSLRARILGLKMTITKKDGSETETQIFKAISENKRQGDGYLLTYHPDAEPLAQEKTKGLYLILKEELNEEELAVYFSPEEILKGQKLKWKDGKVGTTVTSEEDEEMQALDALDEDMKFTATIPATNSGSENKPIRLTRDRMDDDTISTLDEGSASKRRKLTQEQDEKDTPAKIRLQSEDSSTGSAVSSVSSKTRRSTETKLSALSLNVRQLEENQERQLKALEEKQVKLHQELRSDIEGMLLRALQAGKPPPGIPNSTLPPVTPAGSQKGGNGGEDG
jgi:hypothetical protein